MPTLPPEFFGASDSEIGSVLTMNGRSRFNSMGTIVPPRSGTDRTRVVKFFSDDPLDAAVLSDMFANPNVLHELTWKAYPKFSTPEVLDPFVVCCQRGVATCGLLFLDPQ